jgi:hypothetical protein
LLVSINQNHHQSQSRDNEKIQLIFAFAVTFALGFAFKSITTKSSNRQPAIKKVTGIGGIFSIVRTQKE